VARVAEAENAFHELASRSIPVHVLTTTYIGATDFNAICELARLSNVELRISLDGRRRRLHAKAWLFQRGNGFSSVYIGSANLSGPALEDGIEWTVKLSEAESTHVVERFRAAFDTLWSDEEFEPFQPGDQEQCRRIRSALEASKSSARQGNGGAPVFFDLRPHPYQQSRSISSSRRGSTAESSATWSSLRPGPARRLSRPLTTRGSRI
jgi:hypothetical protein